MKRKNKAKPTTKNITASGIQSLSYQGKVVIKVANGDKVIMRKEYHNSGMPRLFEFLVKSLAGHQVDSLRPMKIKLFRYPAADIADVDTQGISAIKPTNFSWNNAFTGNASAVDVSPYVLFDTTPVIIKKDIMK